MRVAYTRKSGDDTVIEVDMLAEYGKKSLLVGNLVFDLYERPIHEYILEAVTKGYLDIRPSMPQKVLDEYEFDAWNDRA